MKAARPFKEELRNFPWPKSSAMRDHLLRWLDDRYAESVWRKLHSAAPDLSANAFIRAVLQARAQAAAAKAILTHHADEREALVDLHARQTKHAFKSHRSLSEIAAVLENAAAELRQAEEYEQAEGLPQGALTQKEQNGSRARRVFYLRIGQFLFDRAGRWMDDTVAALADTALPAADAHTPDQVRAARRPTTRADRRSPPH